MVHGSFIASAGQRTPKPKLCRGVGAPGRSSALAIMGDAAVADRRGLLVEMCNFGIPCRRRKNSLTGGANSMLPQERGKNAAAI